MTTVTSATDYPVPSIFTKARTICFGVTSALAFVWTILLCVFIFVRWDVSDNAERAYIFVMIFINVATVIMLPVLLIVKFRPWLDAARLALLLTTHIGITATFAIHNPHFACPEHSTDGVGVCRLLNVYILLASLVVPTLLVIYAIALAYMAYRSYKQPLKDAEAGQRPHISTAPGLRPLTLVVEDISRHPQRSSHISELAASRPPSQESFETKRKSNRLSKPIPHPYAR